MTEKELESLSYNEEEVTFAKQELGDKKQQTKLLGLPLHKSKDSLSITLEQEEYGTTKRRIIWTRQNIWSTGVGLTNDPAREEYYNLLLITNNSNL